MSHNRSPSDAESSQHKGAQHIINRVQQCNHKPASAGHSEARGSRRADLHPSVAAMGVHFREITARIVCQDALEVVYWHLHIHYYLCTFMRVFADGKRPIVASDLLSSNTHTRMSTDILYIQNIH